jgi:hypothetical protein
MGSGASTPNAANEEDDSLAAVLSYSPSEFNLDDFAWIKIYHSYETTNTFSAVVSPLLYLNLFFHSSHSLVDFLFH